MKRIIAILLAIVVMAPLGVCMVSASAPSCSVHIEASADSYNAGDFIDVAISLRDINFGSGDGVSLFEFTLFYDPSMVSLVNVPLTDEDGVDVDFSSLLSANVADKWEAIGKVYEEGYFEFACGDISALNVVTQDDELVVTMRFKVLAGVAVDSLNFETGYVKVYNKDCTVVLDLLGTVMDIPYAAQPNTSVSLPSDAIALDYAGYTHSLEDNYNFIFYSESARYVTDYVSRYINPVSGQDKLEGFGIIVVDANNDVTAVDLTNSDKSLVRIPEGSYILVIDLDNTSDISALSDVAVGDDITLYNINVEGTGNYFEPIALNKAGFTYAEDSGTTDPDNPDNPDNPTDFAVVEGANAILEDDRKFVRVYESSLDLEAFSAMFVGEFTVHGLDGELFAGEFVSTGMTIVAGDETITIIIMGDVTGDGAVNSRDYSLVKRYCFGTYIFDEIKCKAAALNDPSEVSKRDYAAVKRFCFGTIKFDSFM